MQERKYAYTTPMNTKPYSRLKALFSLYEENYLQLSRQRDAQNGDWYCIINSGTDNESRWECTAIDKTPYTEVLEILQRGRPLPIRLRVRIYHDARMAEVEGAQHIRRLSNYRRPGLEARDERTAWNLLLRDLLRLCRLKGKVARAPSVPVASRNQT